MSGDTCVAKFQIKLATVANTEALLNNPDFNMLISLRDATEEKIKIAGWHLSYQKGFNTFGNNNFPL